MRAIDVQHYDPRAIELWGEALEAYLSNRRNKKEAVTQHLPSDKAPSGISQMWNIRFIAASS